MNITSKITAACAFDAKLVDAEIDRLRAADIPFNQTFGFSMGARFQHAKDQRIILALAAQLESVVAALDSCEGRLLYYETLPKELGGGEGSAMVEHARVGREKATRALTDVRKFVETLEGE